MADAIRHITLARGVNPADYTLVSFRRRRRPARLRGGAAAGIRRLLVSPFAAVLSAYGIGLAERRQVRQVAVEQVLDEPLTHSPLFADARRAAAKLAVPCCATRVPTPSSRPPGQPG